MDRIETGPSRTRVGTTRFLLSLLFVLTLSDAGILPLATTGGTLADSANDQESSSLVFVRKGADSLITIGFETLDSLAQRYARTNDRWKESNGIDSLIVDEMPAINHQAIARYPEAAIRKNKEGIVWIRSLCDTLGAVRATYVIEASEDAKKYGFVDEALLMATQTSYFPAKIDGRPVPVWVVFPVEFRLK